MNEKSIVFTYYIVITDYLVQFDDDDWLPGKWKNLSTYPGNLNSVILHLIPFTYYQFRVLAINEIGMSRPSRPSMRFQSSGARELITFCITCQNYEYLEVPNSSVCCPVDNVYPECRNRV